MMDNTVREPLLGGNAAGGNNGDGGGGGGGGGEGAVSSGRDGSSSSSSAVPTLAVDPSRAELSVAVRRYMGFLGCALLVDFGLTFAGFIHREKFSWHPLLRTFCYFTSF